MQIDLGMVATSASSALGAAWLVRFFFKRLIDENDKKHAENDAEIKSIKSTVEEIRINMAVLTKSVATSEAMRDDVKKCEQRIAVIEPKLDRAHERIDDVKAASNS